MRRLAEECGAQEIVFDNSLTPSQVRNLGNELELPIIDRTNLILDIFAIRAQTREAKLQVETARLQYMLPRLVGMYDALSRQGGASGSMSNKGTGEKKLELDRRKIEHRITELKKELEDVGRTPKRAAAVMAALKKQGRDSIKIRTVLTCKSHIGVCAKCYGANMATGQPVQVGEAVGIIAAQSIGEPGTQLTMRTFHSGGVAGGDITQGLPRVEELFEARKPKGLAIIAEFGGVATIKDTKKKREIIITDNETGNSKTYLIPYGSRIKIQDGAVLEAGDELTEGSVNPHDILKIKGVRAVQDYMIQEVQRVYRLQGVEINDKHIEMIVHQMLKKIKIEESGDSDVLPGVSMDVLDFNEMNEALEAEGKEPAIGRQVMLGITKASLATDSFLSAASFQETTKVLTEAAINGKVDKLIGLKENVLIGKLIPAGTGMKRYRSIKLNTDVEEEDDIDLAEDDFNEPAELDEADKIVLNEDELSEE